MGESGRSGKTSDDKPAKRRVLSMKEGSVKMNPHYRETGHVSALETEERGSGGMLQQAIARKDLSYISEVLAGRNRRGAVERLSWSDKERLGELLLEFVDQPLRNEALETIREIVSSIRNVESFIDRLKERVVDFSKLVYVKGKIDYLRFTMDSRDEDEAEVEIRG